MSFEFIDNYLDIEVVRFGRGYKAAGVVKELDPGVRSMWSSPSMLFAALRVEELY